MRKTITYMLSCVVCVDIPFILDVRFVNAPAGITQEDVHTGFLYLPSAVPALILLREGFSRPFPSSTVKSNFVYPRKNRFPFVKRVVRKTPSLCDCAEVQTHGPSSESFEVTN